MTTESLPVSSASALTSPASFLAFPISEQSITSAGLPSVLVPISGYRKLTHFSSFFRTRLSKFCLPLPGGPVNVMNVEGYSDNHLSTLFSASTRSRQAF